MSKILLAAFALCLAVNLAASDWPQFRGPRANGFSDEKINTDWKSKPPKELWRVALSDNGYAGPSVVGGLCFIVDHKGADDIVRAIDATSGQDKWTFSYADGAKDNYGFTESTPVFDNGKLYVFSRQGKLHCLDAAKGTQIWARDCNADFKGRFGGWQLAASPVIDANKVIVSVGGPTALVALDKNTGSEIWRGGPQDQAGYSTPVIATLGGKRQYLLFSGTMLSGVDCGTGRNLWSFPWKTGCDVNAAMPIVIGENVFITSGYNKGCALVAPPSQAVWQNKAIAAHFSTPILYQGYLYGATGNQGGPNPLVCLDPKTGTEKWKQPGFEAGGGIALDSGLLIMLDGQNGNVALVKMSPDSYQERGRIMPLGGRSWTAPVLAGGKLYIRNTKTLVCLDVAP